MVHFVRQTRTTFCSIDYRQNIFVEGVYLTLLRGKEKFSVVFLGIPRGRENALTVSPRDQAPSLTSFLNTLPRQSALSLVYNALPDLVSTGDDLPCCGSPIPRQYQEVVQGVGDHAVSEGRFLALLATSFPKRQLLDTTHHYKLAYTRSLDLASQATQRTALDAIAKGLPDTAVFDFGPALQVRRGPCCMSARVLRAPTDVPK
ncbi:hypothetical protein H4582DRAFT_2062838 [Lactarius indigo]|nr:hypothetical protein H4582DRAFT_2062838 [Lactarius indigo]